MIMQDDGSGHTINIPSFLIRHSTSTQIKKVYASDSEKKIIMKFIISHASSTNGKVDVDLWFSSTFDLTAKMMSGLINKLPLLSEYINFDLHLMSSQCLYCSTER